MKRSKFSEEQIVYAIRQAEADTPIGVLCRQLGPVNDPAHLFTFLESVWFRGRKSLNLLTINKVLRPTTRYYKYSK